MNLTDHSLSSTTIREAGGRSDNDGYVLTAHPGRSQGRPRKTPGSQPTAPTACPTFASQEQPLSRATDPAPGTGQLHCPSFIPGQRERLHRPPLQGEARRARQPPSPRRLPRPLVASFFESWFGKLKEREVWLNECETPRPVPRRHRRPRRPLPPRPHSGLD